MQINNQTKKWRISGTSTKQEHDCLAGRTSTTSLKHYFPFKYEAWKVMVVLLGDAIPPPSPFTQDSTQVFAHGAPSDFRTKHIRRSNAKVPMQTSKQTKKQNRFSINPGGSQFSGTLVVVLLPSPCFLEQYRAPSSSAYLCSMSPWAR